MKTFFCYFLILLFLTSNSYGQSRTFNWIKQIGGKRQDVAYSVATDKKGNVITVGHFKDTVDFDPGIGTYIMSTGIESQVFITKLDSSGNFIWAKKIPIDNNFDRVIAKTDNLGNIIIAGRFNKETDFNPGVGIKLLKPNGNRDSYILKLDADGNFLWVCHLKTISTGITEPSALAIDKFENIYVGGAYGDSIEVVTSMGTTIIPQEPGGAGYLIKLDATGNVLWSTSANGFKQIQGIGIDDEKNILLTGIFRNKLDFAPNTAVFNMNSLLGSDDIFITKLDSSANFMWAKQIGGVSMEASNDNPCIDKWGNFYMCGVFKDTVDFDPSPLTKQILVCTDKDGYSSGFVLCLDKNGDFRWVRKMGDRTGVHSIAIDSFGYLYVTGTFGKTMDLTPKIGGSTISLSTVAISEIFISMLDGKGNFIWAHQTKGVINGINSATNIAINPFGFIYVTGLFQKGEFSPEDDDKHLLTMVDTIAEASFGMTDAFVLKMSVYGRVASGINHFKNPSLVFPTVYPNPCSNELTVLYNEPVNFIITDVSGRVHLSASNKKVIDITSLLAGIYFVSITDEMNNLLSVEKIIKVD